MLLKFSPYQNVIKQCEFYLSLPKQMNLLIKLDVKILKPEKILITVQMCIRKDTSVGRGINLLILFCILFPSPPLV